MLYLSQILSKPYINGKIIYSAFRLCINLNVKKIDPYDWICAPRSHTCVSRLESHRQDAE